MLTPGTWPAFGHEASPLRVRNLAAGIQWKHSICFICFDPTSLHSFHFYFWKLEASLRYSWRVTWQVCIKLWAWVHEYVSWLNYRGWSCQLLDEGLDGWTYSDKRWTDQLPPWQELKPRTNTLLICIKSVSEKKMRVHFRGLRKQSIHVWSPKKLILLKKKKSVRCGSVM